MKVGKVQYAKLSLPRTRVPIAIAMSLALLTAGGDIHRLQAKAPRLNESSIQKRSQPGQGKPTGC
jgi:hypothetical protein